MAQKTQLECLIPYDDSTFLHLTDTAGGTITLQQTLTFAVMPGEEFYVWQRLAAGAAGDARSADAFSTLTATFCQPELVQSLAAPEPSVAMLLGLGLGALAVRGRARR